MSVSFSPMRFIDVIQRVSVEYDQSTAGGGLVAATAVHVGGLRLANHLEVVEFSADATQVLVCEQCGHTGCARGGWVALRRLGDSVVWMPAFERMGTDEVDCGEYGPPAYIASDGVPRFSRAAWQQLRGWRSGVPDVSVLPSVSAHEMTRVLQWTAPGRVLGRYPERPTLRPGVIVAVTDGDLATEIRAVEDALARDFERHQPAAAPLASEFEPIEFWLDLRGAPRWRPFGRVDGDVAIALTALDDGPVR